ncbi:MAG: type II toxin-antitoxin system prevent-host-death family antitoxin [Rickettsiales bacterium]|jgi:antitoxin YefM|nr:type II toxin-antitoxin system prevent-host-death family antitoxin [Rickettsiales bacterium]
MELKTYTELRKNLTASMDFVNENRMPLIVTRNNKKPVVIMSLEDFNGYQETNYLLGTKNNRNRLLKSVENIKKGNFIKKKLIEE